MPTFYVKSLEEVAAMFDRSAWQATAFSNVLHKTQRAKREAEREAATWKRAADMLRNTEIVQ